MYKWRDRHTDWMTATQAPPTEYFEAEVNFLIPKQYEAALIGKDLRAIGPYDGIKATAIERVEPTIKIPERAMQPGATNAIEKALLAAISHCGHLAPSQLELASIAGCGKTALNKHLAMLREKGLADWSNNPIGHSNTYWLTAK